MKELSNTGITTWGVSHAHEWNKYYFTLPLLTLVEYFNAGPSIKGFILVNTDY